MFRVTILRHMSPLWIATPHTILIDNLIREFTYDPISNWVNCGLRVVKLLFVTKQFWLSIMCPIILLLHLWTPEVHVRL